MSEERKFAVILNQMGNLLTKSRMSLQVAGFKQGAAFQYVLTVKRALS
ncbi:hypothetical protein DEU53_1093 [Pantoea sp. AG1095]|nr:hypothetical protein DEU53_1093 [Pantoea sp. AG1095]